jgi:hypothetical protein
MYWPVGDSHTRVYTQALSDIGVPVDLTGSTMTAKLRQVGTTSFEILTGQGFLITPQQGVFSWQFSPSDVSQSGVYKMIFTATYGVSDLWNSFEFDFILLGSP